MLRNPERSPRGGSNLYSLAGGATDGSRLSILVNLDFCLIL